MAIFESDQTDAFDDSSVIAVKTSLDESIYSPLAGTIRKYFEEAANERQTDEDRWLRAYRNYRGVYDGGFVVEDSEQSKIFIKITKTKVLAAYGQIIDVLFSNDRFPLTIEPTKIPEGIAEYANVDPAAGQNAKGGIPNRDPYGYPGDGNDLAPGATAQSILGGLANRLGTMLPWKKGPAPTPQHIQIEPARIAAKSMEKLIMDQLEESNITRVLSKTCFEMAMLGHGIVKGPFNYNKVLHKWTKNMADPEAATVYEPINKLIPKLEFVSIWDFYPDPSARNLEEAEWVIQRHRLTTSQLRALLHRPYFDKDAVEMCIEEGTGYDKQGYEDQLHDEEDINELANRFEVLEFWGIIDKDLALEAGLDIPNSMTNLDEIQINAWVCGKRLIRLVANPFTPARIPYNSAPYETNPYRFFGIGVAENMDDSQMIMNGAARMCIDNLKISGNLIFDVDEQALVPGQDMRIFPGKQFRRQGGAPGQAVFGIKFPNTTNENMSVFDRFRQLADEQTGIPSYSHGQTGINSTTRTASGMSMLMGAAALNIKTVIKNLDDYIIQPIGESLFAWNMQFNKDLPEIVGDLDIHARGSASLMKKEIKSQRLMMLMQVGSNPVLAPFVKWDKVLKEVVATLDLDPETTINDANEAKIYALIMGNQNGRQIGTPSPISAPEPPGGENLGMVAGASPADTSGAGGGTIGTGSVPTPGESGFSARTS